MFVWPRRPWVADRMLSIIALIKPWSLVRVQASLPYSKGNIMNILNTCFGGGADGDKPDDDDRDDVSI